MASGPAVNRKRRECISLLGYCQFEKLKLLMERNEHMVNSLRKSDFEMVCSKQNSNPKGKKGYLQDDADAKYKRVEEITHLYDALLQNARTVVSSSATTGATLLRRLDDFDSGGKSFRLANVPPALEPIVCKASFFDIAHNYVTDFLEEDSEFNVNAHKLQSKGFVSWFRKQYAMFSKRIGLSEENCQEQIASAILLTREILR